jgi:AraC-like DNA-binding protein
MVTIYIYLAAWRGITQPTIWQVQPSINKANLETILTEATPEQEKPANGNPKPRKAGLNELKINEITSRIITLMEVDKLYQEPELTLQQLASRLQLSVHHLSQAINDGLKKSFYDLVNGYRVEEAKRLLMDDKTVSYTILSIGFEAGFNSKTTFNTVFKKFTGLTPSDFRQLQNEPSLISN